MNTGKMRKTAKDNGKGERAEKKRKEKQEGQNRNLPNERIF